MKLEEAIKERILILDGAMGTMIQSYDLREEDFRGDQFVSVPGLMKGNNDILNLTRPDVVSDIHRRYLEAGCDIIETNTFSSQRISMSDYHVEDYVQSINRAGCRIARHLADEYTQKNPHHPRFVVGSVGPTNKTCSMSPDVNNPSMRNLTFDELSSAYLEQMTVMIEEGVDGLLIETIFDTLNAKCAIYAAEEAMQAVGRRVPLMLSVTVADKSGRTLSGQTLEAFLASIDQADIFSVGLNCSFGADQLKPFLRTLSEKAPYYISAYPNAGLPNSLGLYDESPEEMAEKIRSYVDESLVNIIGGCCGTTDEYLRLYPALIVDGQGQWKRPHERRGGEREKNGLPHHASDMLHLSGLEVLDVSEEKRFINVGERCNVAGSKKFKDLIIAKDYDSALAIARKQVEDGAMVLDVNMDDAMLDARHEMVTFLNLMMSDPDVARVPVMIDSSKWEVIHAGLKCLQGKGIVNSISLKEGKEVFVDHAREIRRLGAAVVVMAFDEEGQATTFERKVSICQRSYDILVHELGFNPHDIIFDPCVLTVATGMKEHNDYAKDFILATEWIRTHLPGAHVSGGVSNLSFAFRGNNYIREAMHAVFLYDTIQKGQDFGIVNPSTKVMYEDIASDVLDAINDVLFNLREDATDRLIEIATRVKAEQTAAKSGNAPSPESSPSMAQSVDDRLIHALMKGQSDSLETDLMEAMSEYGNPVSIIEGPLMAGMTKVGTLFGEGKMFLPQVVKTARTMKKAVSILQPYIEASQSSASKKAGKVLLATVKGDVHDIGKNIVSVIMACNNYEIIDLGVMVPAEEIVRVAKEQQVDIIGLSGLITPSLEEMVNVAKALEEAKLDIPLMIGGATTSELHTALKISPVYSAPIVWLKDASQNTLAASRLIGSKEDYAEELRQRYSELREAYSQKDEPLLSLEEARQRKPKLF
ncbi:MAG: methionine synthase [Bacteroidaceae bacterium]|nr:methionine synthase [Bacteroidaceae bacterium]